MDHETKHPIESRTLQAAFLGSCAIAWNIYNHVSSGQDINLTSEQIGTIGTLITAVGANLVVAWERFKPKKSLSRKS